MTDDIDDVSARAILALQLQEVEELKHSFAGEEETDQTIALQAYQEDLERRATTLRDHHLATLFGQLPPHDDSLPEAPPATAVILPIDTVERSVSPDCTVTNIEDNKQPGDIQRDDIQQCEIQQDSIQTGESKMEASNEIGNGPPGEPCMLGSVRRNRSESHTTDPSPTACAGMSLLSQFRSEEWDHTSEIDEEFQLHNITSDLKAAQSHGPSENSVAQTSKSDGSCLIPPPARIAGFELVSFAKVMLTKATARKIQRWRQVQHVMLRSGKQQGDFLGTLIATTTGLTGWKYIQETFNAKIAEGFRGTTSMNALCVYCENVRHADNVEDRRGDGMIDR
ncbi:MAG: hypothetical protein Q9209_007257 [Squamulea sp. 1 TL-2023]